MVTRGGLELRVEEVVLEVPGTVGESEVQALVQQALALLAERLQSASPQRGGRLERLTVEGFSMDLLRSERGVEALTDALHAQLMETWR